MTNAQCPNQITFGPVRTLLLSFLLLLSLFSFAQDFPARSNTLVTDFSNTLSADEQRALEQKLVAFNDSTSTQVAIVIIQNIGGYDISEYAVRLFNEWKIGQQQKNNGVLILVAKENRKVFITTGYGIEGVLPDALCKRIVDRDIVPHFKQGDYYGGLEASTNSIMSIVKGEYTADAYMKRGGKTKSPLSGLLIALIIIGFVLFSRVNRARRHSRLNGIPFWTAWMLMNAAGSRSHGSFGGFSGGGGGFGGGGFGGFGGGMSGGGGAGGSW
jgi:uncharacterized protein